MLLDNGDDVNIPGDIHGTALQAACRKGHENTVQKLLDNGADVNIQDGMYSTALQAACLNRHKNIVQMLLDKGADVNCYHNDSDTPFNLLFMYLEKILNIQ